MKKINKYISGYNWFVTVTTVTMKVAVAAVTTVTTVATGNLRVEAERTAK